LIFCSALGRHFFGSWVKGCPCADFTVQSQLVVVNLTGLEQTANLHGTLALLVLDHLCGFLAILNEQVGVVSSKLFELDEEVSECQLESVDVVGLTEQIGDEFLDLNTARVGQSKVLGEYTGSSLAYVVRLGKALASRLPTKF